MQIEYMEKMEPFNDIELSGPNVAKEIVRSLPPVKAAALISILKDIQELFPEIPSETIMEEINELRESLNRLQKISSGLHMTLDGVV